MPRTNLPLKPILILIGLALIWGTNWAVVKIGGREMAPLFMAGLRSLIAAALLFLWIKAKGLKTFTSRAVFLHGLIVGLIFGVEFGLIYFGLKLTLASRVYVLLYTAPFWAALGAHFFLEGDRLSGWKTGGLVLAFTGVASLFFRDFGALTWDTLPGDLMIVAGGAAWAATTLYIKKYLAHRTAPLQSLFYSVFFSAPLLLGLSLALERPMFHDLSLTGASSMFYQGVIVAFASYLVWMELVHRFPASLLHAFSFFTPLFGVFLSGWVILGEPMGLNLITGLVLVSAGLVLVNR
ncbi:MAG: DMT family transporter [Thermodesulfobacteriota bacterium]